MTLTIRGLTLNEQDWARQQLSGRRGQSRVRRFRIVGEESSPPLTPAQAETQAELIASLADSDEPVPFTATTQAWMSGWYHIRTAQARVETHGTTRRVSWLLDVERVGEGDSDSQLEATLTGVDPRTNDHSIVAGEPWHAVPADAVAPYYGTGSPGTVTRTTAAGDVTVHRDVPAATPCRYLLAPADALVGQAQVSMGGYAMVGRSGIPSDPTDWELTNGLLRIRQSSTEAFQLAIRDSGAWASELDWRVTIGGTALGVPDAIQVLRNDIPMAAVRLVWENNQLRHELDLALRRGAHHAAFVLRSSASSTHALEVNDGAASAGTGYRQDSANDGDGNRWAIGSPNTLTDSNPASWRGIQQTGVALPGYVALILGGSGAASGNAADDVRDQYLSDLAEMTRVVAP